MTVRAWATLLLCGGLIVGCQSSSTPAGKSAENGPLRIGGEQGSVCTPLTKSDSLTVGTEVLENKGHGVRISKVELVDAHGLELVDSSVARLPPMGQLVGLWPSFPPPSSELSRLGSAWTGRQPVPGAAVSDAGTAGVTNLVLDLRLTPPAMSAKAADVHAFRITYTTGGKTYTATSTTSYRLAPVCK